MGPHMTNGMARYMIDRLESWIQIWLQLERLRLFAMIAQAEHQVIASGMPTEAALKETDFGHFLGKWQFHMMFIIHFLVV
jgi:hypothetical protein